MKKWTILSIAMMLVVGTATAGTKTWNGNNDGDWNDAGNWTEGLPVNGDDLVFPAGASTLVMNNDMTGLHVNSLTFTGGGYELTGSAITMPGAVSPDIYADNAAGNVTIGIDITTSPAQVLSIQSDKVSGTVTFNGAIDITSANKLTVQGNAGSIVFNGVLTCKIAQIGCWGGSSSKVYFNAANAIASRTHLLRGTLVLGDNNALNGGQTRLGRYQGDTTIAILDLNGVTLSSDIATFDYASSGDWPDPAVVQNSSSTPAEISGTVGLNAYDLVVDGAGDITFSGVVTLASPLIKRGSGELTLSNAGIAYTGTTDIEAGTFNMTGTHTGGGAYTVADGATLAGDGTIGAAVTVESGGTILPGDDAAGTLTVSDLTLNTGAVFGWRHDASGGSSVTVSSSDGLALDSSMTIDLRHTGGSFVPADEFTLLAYTGTGAASLPGTVTYQTIASSAYIDAGSAALSTAGSYEVRLSGLDGTAPASQFSAWKFKLPIDLPGYTHSETLDNFPVLVALSESIPGFHYTDFLNGDHNDLRFSDRWQQTELKYEVETWNPSGTSYVWVAVGSLVDADVLTTRIWAHWGKSDAEAPSPAATAATWDSNYMLVWHLDETSGGTFYDSTAENNGGETNGFSLPGASKAGMAGLGQGIKADLPVDRIIGGDLDGYAALTLEAWFKMDTAPATGHIMIPAEKSQCYGMQIGNVSGNFRAHCHVYDTDGDELQRYFAHDADPLGVDTWYYAAGVWDGSELDAYRDGVLKNLSQYLAADPVGGSIADESTLFVVSTETIGAVDAFDGNIDEIRISNTVRSPDWIWATHETIRNNATFVSFGAVKEKTPRGTLFIFR